MNPMVPSKELAGAVDHFTAPSVILIRVGCHQCFVIAETNVLALRPFRYGQSETARVFAHLALMQLAEREQCVRELALRQ